MVATPANTPSFFRNPLFKGPIMLLVVTVATVDPVVGLLFGLAIILTIGYSHVCVRQSQDNFSYHTDDTELHVPENQHDPVQLTKNVEDPPSNLLGVDSAIPVGNTDIDSMRPEEATNYNEIIGFGSSDQFSSVS
jgi:hypothetical protein